VVNYKRNAPAFTDDLASFDHSNDLFCDINNIQHHLLITTRHHSTLNTNSNTHITDDICITCTLLPTIEARAVCVCSTRRRRSLPAYVLW